jgi:hypothetical protein
MNIRDISPEQLQQLGMPSIAYFKPVMVKGTPAYAIHAADGTPMAVAADRDLAIAVVLENEMHPTWVH